MNDYNPTTYLVRVLYKTDGAAITMDTTGNEIMQAIIASQIEDTGLTTMKEFGMTYPEKGAVLFEVLTGATANQLSRREDLLNDVRNMLIDLESIPLESLLKERQRKPIADLIDEIGEEIGVPL